MNNTPRQLPNKLSALILLAVADCKKLKKTPGYKLDMALWHEPVGKKCHVCMAGAVMACELGASTDRDYLPSSFNGDNTSYALSAINAARIGDIYGALWIIGIKICPSRSAFLAINKAEPAIQGSLSKRLQRAPWRVYEKVAKSLAEVGL